jgi:hypothetical protein
MSRGQHGEEQEQVQHLPSDRPGYGSAKYPPNALSGAARSSISCERYVLPNSACIGNSEPNSGSTVPFIVWGFFKLITPFIDPRTKEKLKFNEDLTQYVPKEQLVADLKGGELKFEYDHSTYWPALHKLCDEKRAEQKARWEAGGKQIGEFEDYLKGHSSHGVAASNASTEPAAEPNAGVEGTETKA